MLLEDTDATDKLCKGRITEVGRDDNDVSRL